MTVFVWGNDTPNTVIRIHTGFVPVVRLYPRRGLRPDNRI